jgi:hypothetical protein
MLNAYFLETAVKRKFGGPAFFSRLVYKEGVQGTSGKERRLGT